MSKGTAMNKQIEQFALECGAWHQVYGHRMFMIDEHFDIEKFARLIVQECLDQLHVNDTDEDYDKGAYWSREQIKNHFGVEL